MRSEISERWAHAMAAIPTLEAMALECRALANHLGLVHAGAEAGSPGRIAYLNALGRADALAAMLVYLRSLPSLTAEPVCERFATDGQADKHSATHMLLVRVPGMENVTRKRRARPAP